MKLLFSLLLINSFTFYSQQNLALKDSSFNFPKDDSLFVAYQQSINYLNKIQPNILKPRVDFDSITTRKKIEFSGLTSITNRYGIINSVIQNDNNTPINATDFIGDIQTNIFKIPLKINYQYSTLTNPIGINNFFNISLDTEKIKQSISEKKEIKNNVLNKQLNVFSDNKTNLLGYLNSGETLMEKYKDELKKNVSETELVKDKIQHSLNDSLELFKDSISRYNKTTNTDSLQKQYNKLQLEKIKITNRIDTINRLYNLLLDSYEMLNVQAEKINSIKNSINTIPTNQNDSLFSAKKSNLISSIQKFDLGLSYPKTSAISKNSIPIQSVNLEIQKQQYYFAFSSGMAMNNFMISSDALQNKLNNTIHSFNQFDFNYLKNKGLITSLKTGYGTIEGNHILLGSSYLTNTTPLNIGKETIPSFYSEIDGRWIPKKNKNIKIDIVYGKSSSKVIDGNQSSLRSFFTASRTRMGLISYNQNVLKLKTEFQTLVRFIDLNADSRNIGILLSDQIRFEVKAKTRIIKGLLIGINYRMDENNISKTKDSTIKLRMYGGQLSGNLFKKLTYFTSFNYLIQNRETNSINRNQSNYMIGLGISSQYFIKGIPNQLSINYSDNLISDTISTGLFKSIIIQNKTKFQSFINNLSLGYYKIDDQQLTTNTALIISNEIKIQKKKYSINLGLKYSNSSHYNTDIGFNACVEYNITRKIIASLKIEKMILGDFYNYYNRTLFNQFPYLFSAKINYILN